MKIGVSLAVNYLTSQSGNKNAFEVSTIGLFQPPGIGKTTTLLYSLEILRAKPHLQEEVKSTLVKMYGTLTKEQLENVMDAIFSRSELLCLDLRDAHGVREVMVDVAVEEKDGKLQLPAD